VGSSLRQGREKGFCLLGYNLRKNLKRMNELSERVSVAKAKNVTLAVKWTVYSHNNEISDPPKVEAEGLCDLCNRIASFILSFILILTA
jgi:hypothetical protein